MEKDQVKINKIYEDLQDLKNILRIKGIISNQDVSENAEKVWDWPSKIPFLGDEKLLAEDWLSPEDEEAWKDL